ncbi:hypothetical protein F2P81_019400 [Scophthalmus maximus]|uniref:Uncharacterized protein n=1 Tax=Scophthalmus maximus TaxID=52904 RepID=A0A6A4S1T4_SCOMX|nr:hypothetical protein F2P81_019400 [Scophthalmus maximus]
MSDEKTGKWCEHLIDDLFSCVVFAMRTVHTIPILLYTCKRDGTIDIQSVRHYFYGSSHLGAPFVNPLSHWTNKNLAFVFSGKVAIGIHGSAVVTADLKIARFQITLTGEEKLQHAVALSRGQSSFSVSNNRSSPIAGCLVGQANHREDVRSCYRSSVRPVVRCLVTSKHQGSSG